MELFAYYLEKLAATPDGDGRLLDHRTIMYACGHSDSNRHLHTNLPIVLLDGFKQAELKGGRHFVAPAKTPLANLYVSLMHKMGVQVQSFGDSTGRLAV